MTARGSYQRFTPVEATLAPVVLIKGSEGLLVDRALGQLKDQARAADPAVELTELNVATYSPGEMAALTSPSLFGESRLIIVRDLETMTDGFAQDLLEYLPQPSPDTWIILVHPGGNARGKKVLDAIVKAKYPVIPAQPLQYDSDKLTLLRDDARRARRHVDPEALQALVDALGNDVRSMCAALNQLFFDIHGRITVEDVRRSQSGRVEATGFEVADAAIDGDSVRALMLLRHALATGASPIALVGALAYKVRNLAKVQVMGNANMPRIALSPRQLDTVRRQLRGWSDASLAAAISALAVADEETKGLSRDPERAVEKAVIQICRLRRYRR
ncbi:DNA polymerase III subunit delta [Schaalia sp. ZJ405]|uniref:DNA polymerase III subunit delta n=1 Tax=Schaalia sp. ZJ405 TaxID=2709403 RepID=UPI0013ED48F5|nr:DNA polymerase III subunit delta [Schaalia sp. ZJ405]QPK80642.1 DNA polymerase III subunit delta [Schaalia sp. ZJ405]